MLRLNEIDMAERYADVRLKLSHRSYYLNLKDISLAKEIICTSNICTSNTCTSNICIPNVGKRR